MYGVPIQADRVAADLPRSSCIFDNPNMSFRSKMISRKRRRYDVGVYLAYVEGFSTMLRREGFDVKSA